MSESRNGSLYLVPVALGGEDVSALLPPATLETVRRLDVFIVENAKSARAFLKSAGHPLSLRDIRMHTLDEHTGEREIDALLSPLRAGTDCGLMSEAGCPAVADPGGALVRRAHDAGIEVVPLVGPSAILLALMASGMDGQRFMFHGYLPVGGPERARALKELDQQARGATQIFIETPYRSASMLQALLENCRPDTSLCLAVDLTLPGGSTQTHTIGQWKKKPPALDRRLVVFLLCRKSA